MTDRIIELMRERDRAVRERDEAFAELSEICEVLDNAPTPRLNNDRTPCTLAERVEWLVWAWQDSWRWIPVEERMPKGDPDTWVPVEARFQHSRAIYEGHFCTSSECWWGLPGAHGRMTHWRLRAVEADDLLEPAITKGDASK